MAVISKRYWLAMVPLPLGLIMLPLVRSAGDDPGHLASAVAGWMLLLLVVLNVVAIIAGSLSRHFHSYLIIAILSGVSAVSVVALGCLAGLIPVAVVWPVSVVFSAWAIFSAGLAKLLRPWGIEIAVVSGITATTILIFSPIVVTPLLAMLQHHGIDWPWLNSIAMNISPAIWLVDALATGLHYNWFIWFHAPLMYQHVVLGQNILMPRLWPWWIPCMAAVIAGVLAAAWPGG